MLIPTGRFVILAGLLIPVITYAGFSPMGVVCAVGAYGMLGIACLVDGILALHMRGKINISADEVIRCAKQSKGTISLEIINRHARQMKIRVGLILADEIKTSNAVRMITLSGDDENWLYEWDFTPMRRGRYPLKHCRLEQWSPLGLWTVQEELELNSELRISPDLSKDKQSLAHLFLNRRSMGIHRQWQLGKGREFEKLREYQPGDCFEDIHWKATAKRNMPITKEFQIERTQEVYVILDASRLSGLSCHTLNESTDDPTNSLLERYVTAATLFGLACERQGDLFGFMAFSDRIESFNRAKSGRAHRQSCQNSMYDLHPRLVMPDYNEAFTFIRSRLRRRALLIFMTDLRDPAQAESFLSGISMISRQHLVLVNMLQAPGVGPLFMGDPVEDSKTIFNHINGHLQWHDLMQLKMSLHRKGVAFNLIKQEKLSVQLINEYLSVKNRQVL